MDMLENKKIRDKINKLDTLPDTYHPNMASKWSLLEASLDGKSEKKGFAWIRFSIAAALVIIVGSALVLFYDETPESTLQVTKKSPVIKQEVKLTAVQPEQKIKNDLQPVKKHSGKKSMLAVPIKEETQLAVIQVEDSIVQPLASGNEKSVLAANTPKKKKPRFTELDFNDNVTIDKPAEVWASRKIKFKTGTDKLSFHEANGEITIGIPLF